MQSRNSTFCPRFSRQFGWKKVVTALVLSSSLGMAATGYLQHNLVADTPGVADFTDPLLVNPWGLTTSAASPFWVCNGGTGTSTVYSASNTPGAGLGTPNATLKPTVSGTGGVQGVCTGIVANTATTSFTFNTPTAPTLRPASFIFATEDGTISAWANAVDPAHAIQVVDNSSTAVYKGLALVATPTPQLYAANFRAGTIDVFDANFKPVTTLAAGSFTDPAVPAGFAPFNIWNLGGKLYVAYAMQDAAKKFDVPGVANGFVAVYDATGKLLTHLISNGPLNSPWGMAIAPATFGQFANALLVGNFGDGRINAFDATTGASLGNLKNPAGSDLVIPGLWALLLGNGGNGGDKDAIYFTAGTSGQKHGLLGSIQANPVVTTTNIINSAQTTAGLAANTFLTIKGSNLAATKRSWATADFVGNLLPTSLDGVTVTLNGKPAYLSYISPVQINLLTPVDLPLTGDVNIVVSNNSLTTAALTLQAQATAPAFFLINSDKYVAAQHANYSVIGPTTLIANATTPAKPGETIVLYGTGFGLSTPAVTNGQIVSTALPLVVKPSIFVNNLPATVTFYGITASGLDQINVTLPLNSPVGALPDGDVSISAQVGNATTPVGALITIKN